jgi:drug/metabolite transporter (DMT)-like permease
VKFAQDSSSASGKRILSRKDMATTTKHKEPSQLLIVAAFAALYLIWGSTYLFIMIAIKTIPPFFLIASRFLIAGAILIAWCLFKGEKIPGLSDILKIAFGGVLMLFIGNGAVTWGEQFLPSGLAAIIVATVPLWFVLLDRRNWQFNFSNRMIIIGIVVGFAGVLLLFSGKGTVDMFGSGMKILSFFILIGGTIAWAAGSLYSKYKEVRASTAMKVAIQMLSAGIAGLFAGFIDDEQKGFGIGNISGQSAFAVIYLIVMGSLVAYMSYIWLLSVRPASLVGTYAYVNPVVAVFLGALILHEAITLQQVIALAVILAGVILVNFAKEQKRPINSKKALLGK